MHCKVQSIHPNLTFQALFSNTPADLWQLEITNISFTGPFLQMNFLILWLWSKTAVLLKSQVEFSRVDIFSVKKDFYSLFYFSNP